MANLASLSITTANLGNSRSSPEGNRESIELLEFISDSEKKKKRHAYPFSVESNRRYQ